MTKDTTDTASGATLTQKELFHRFLDAPIYHQRSNSTLIRVDCISDETMQDHIFGFSDCTSSVLPFDLPHRIVEDLRGCDDPENEIENIISDLEGLLVDLRKLESEFFLLTERTRTEEPDEEKMGSVAFAEALSEWNDNPKYVLPEPEDEHKTLRDAHAVMSKLSKEGVVA